MQGGTHGGRDECWNEGGRRGRQRFRNESRQTDRQAGSTSRVTTQPGSRSWGSTTTTYLLPGRLRVDHYFNPWARRLID